MVFSCRACSSRLRFPLLSPSCLSVCREHVFPSSLFCSTVILRIISIPLPRDEPVDARDQLISPLVRDLRHFGVADLEHDQHYRTASPLVLQTRLNELFLYIHSCVVYSQNIFVCTCAKRRGVVTSHKESSRAGIYSAEVLKCMGGFSNCFTFFLCHFLSEIIGVEHLSEEARRSSGLVIFFSSAKEPSLSNSLRRETRVD